VVVQVVVVALLLKQTTYLMEHRLVELGQVDKVTAAQVE
jgi:hypothetical protein